MNRLPIFLGFFGVVACWIVFAVMFLSQGRSNRSGEERKDQVSRLGVILQSLSYSVAWMTPPKYYTPLLSDSFLVGWIEAVAAVALSVASVSLCWWALRALGRNWSVVARVTDEHELVRTGPYAWVRNPIYAGMLGMLIATALVISQWWGALIALVIFHIGTMVRIRGEERLLSAQFGQKFDEYRKEVPPYLPGVRL